MTSVTHNDLLMRQKCEAMIEYAHTAMRNFPKVERHVIHQDIRVCLWQILRLVILLHKKYYKKNTLQDLDVEIDILRSRIRLAMKWGYLDFKKYEHWAKLNDEIGRMVGGWIKKMEERELEHRAAESRKQQAVKG